MLNRLIKTHRSFARRFSTASSNSSVIKVFGHKIPDTDATCSALAHAWYLEQKGLPATAYVLGNINNETTYVLDTLNIRTPMVLDPDVALTDKDHIAIVDTNNPQELPKKLGDATIHSIVDHHKVVFGFSTPKPIEIDMRPLCSAGSIIYARMIENNIKPTKEMAGLLLSCILSDSLMFYSSTSTFIDRRYAIELEQLSGLNIETHGTAMLEEKSKLGDMTPKEIVLSDSKIQLINEKKLVVCVFETIRPEDVIERADKLRDSMAEIRDELDVEEVLFFVIDIEKGAKTTFIGDRQSANDLVLNAWPDMKVNKEGNIFLPGVISRKNDIIPPLSRSD